MTEGFRYFLVGLTSIVALVGLAVLLVLFGELEALQKPRYELRIRTDHAAGLRPGSSVELNGVPIGVIDEIEASTGEWPVVVTALVDRGVLIPTGAQPSSAASLLGGAAVLEIEAVAEGADGTFLPTDGTASISAPLRVQVLEQIRSELDVRMAPIMDRLERFDALSETYLELGRNLNSLVEPRDPEALANGEPPNLREAVARLYDVLDNTHEAITLARDWLGDEQMRADARSAVEKASALMDQASESLERFTEVAVAVEEDADELVKRLLPVADDLATTLEAFRNVADAAEKGDGTMARMLNDPQLYLSLNDAAVRLEQTLRELRLLIQKVQAEGLPLDL
jgi:phospholipid/cholesterol/gamma-HCH transport system substrate-binding protein